MMNTYELTLVLDQKATPAKKKAVSEQVEKIVKVLEGKIGKMEDWGEKESGQLLHFLLELESASAKSLTTKLNGEEAVKKHLLIRK